jgi:hypothetical protein
MRVTRTLSNPNVTRTLIEFLALSIIKILSQVFTYHGSIKSSPKIVKTKENSFYKLHEINLFKLIGQLYLKLMAI